MKAVGPGEHKKPKFYSRHQTEKREKHLSLKIKEVAFVQTAAAALTELSSRTKLKIKYFSIEFG